MNKTIQKFLPKIVGFRLNSLFLIQPKEAIAKAFYLFCSPRRGKVKAEQAVFLNPAKSEKIQVEGKSIQTYHWKGSGKKILLLHGWESNAHRWKQLIEKLQEEDYDIIAIDAPAHGNSSGKLFNVPLYSKCIDAVVERFEPNFIIAHSVGAMTAVYNQHTNPNDQISKMVLLGAPSELNWLIKDFQKILNLRPRFMKAFEKYFQEKFGYTFREFSTTKFASTIPQKGLLVHDKYDKIVPVLASEAIHENWADSELFSTEGAGHSLNNDVVLDKIVNFLNQ